MLYKHLTAEERGKIEAYLDEGLRPTEIARRLDRHRSTITREIQRGTEARKANSIARLPYQASSEQNIAKLRKKNCGVTKKTTIHNTKTILKYLNLKYSPEKIAHSVKNVKVCTSTIYNWIYSKTIDLRPESVQLRTEFGHWETDTVVSKRGISTCLATFIERKTRQYVAIKLPNKTGRAMMAAIKKLIKMYPQGVKSITCDRGTEFLINFKSCLLKTPSGATFTMQIRMHLMNVVLTKIIMDYLENISLNRLILRMSRSALSMTL